MFLGVLPGEHFTRQWHYLPLVLLEVGCLVTIHLIENQHLLRHGRVALQSLSQDLTYRFTVLAALFGTIFQFAFHRMSVIVRVQHQKLLWF